MSPYNKRRSWWPTDKWVLGTLTAAGTVGLMFWVGDGVDTVEEKTLVVGLLVQRLQTYWTPNRADDA